MTHPRRRATDHGPPRRRRNTMYAVAAATVAAVLLIVVVAIVSRDRLQAERARSIRTSCQQTNHRNADTKRIVRERFPTGEGREITLLLIDALAPHQDCDALVKQRVSGR